MCRDFPSPAKSPSMKLCFFSLLLSVPIKPSDPHLNRQYSLMENMYILEPDHPKVNVRPDHFPAIYLFLVHYFTL